MRRRIEAIWDGVKSALFALFLVGASTGAAMLITFPISHYFNPLMAAAEDYTREHNLGWWTLECVGQGHHRREQICHAGTGGNLQAFRCTRTSDTDRGRCVQIH